MYYGAMETLHDINQVIKALGGPTKVAKLTKRTPQAACNWRGRGAFPPDTFLVMTAALHAAGKKAPPSLWRMSEAA